jgi:hypothetical protein
MTKPGPRPHTSASLKLHGGLAQHCNCKVAIADWTSDASGDAVGTFRKIVGRLIKAVTVPGAGGSAPSDNYDITLTDEQSVDVLAGCKLGLADRDQTNAEEVDFFVLNNDTAPLSMALSPLVCNVLTVTVANAGDSKSGTLRLYFQTL